MTRTSLTHPIRMNSLPLQNGEVGLTFCPGKHGDSLTGAPWARDLEVDLLGVKAWGARMVVTLMERHEFDLLKVPDLDKRVAAHGMAWLHLPIIDQDVPSTAFEAAWPLAGADLLRRLHEGQKIMLHCRGGLGRTGLVAAMLLIETGMAPDHAMQKVREVRPGAIETRGQEDFVWRYKSLGLVSDLQHDGQTDKENL
jgi:ADP-ribosyl-[dinitrogen reductase] hydrolase